MRPTTSASNLFRRALCPGSARMEAGLPEEDSEQSREGQLLHDYAAHPEYERSVLKPQQRDLLELNESLIETVKDRVKERCPNQAQIGFSIAYEIILGEDSLISGTPDIVVGCAEDNSAWINDSKFGFTVVERAELNLQLRVYAVLAYDALDKPNHVFVSITQPRSPYSERITMAEYKPEDIAASRQQIQGILDESSKPDASLVPGEVQCRYCKAKLTCPAFRESMMLPAVITPDNALSKTAREAYLAQRLSELKDEELDKVLVACSLAKSVSTIAMDEARKRDYFQFSDDYEVRSIVDVRRALALMSLAGFTKTDSYDCVTEMPIGKIADKLRKLHPTWSAKQANEWINNKLASVIEYETRKGRILRK